MEHDDSAVMVDPLTMRVMTVAQHGEKWRRIEQSLVRLCEIKAIKIQRERDQAEGAEVR